VGYLPHVGVGGRLCGAECWAKRGPREGEQGYEVAGARPTWLGFRVHRAKREGKRRIKRKAFLFLKI
jgi:hypothetical protein